MAIDTYPVAAEIDWTPEGILVTFAADREWMTEVRETEQLDAKKAARRVQTTKEGQQR